MTVLCGRWRRNRCEVIKCLSGSVVVFNRLLVGDNVTYKKEIAGDFSNCNITGKFEWRCCIMASMQHSWMSILFASPFIHMICSFSHVPQHNTQLSRSHLCVSYCHRCISPYVFLAIQLLRAPFPTRSSHYNI